LFSGAHGILLVYDVTNIKSLENISTWLKNIKTHAADDVEIILVGNMLTIVNNQLLTMLRE